MRRTLLALVAFALPAAQAQDELRPGLVAEYYDIGEELNDFPNLKDMEPTLRRIEPDVNIPQTNGQFSKSGLIQNFFVRWSGILQVPKSGRISFYTESDDGSRLFIDGKLVVDNGGLHIPEEKSGQVELPAGPHEIRIEFFQAGGGASCKVKWATDDVKSEIIPGKVLFHKKDRTLDK